MSRSTDNLTRGVWEFRRLGVSRLGVYGKDGGNSTECADHDKKDRMIVMIIMMMMMLMLRKAVQTDV